MKRETLLQISDQINVKKSTKKIKSCNKPVVGSEAWFTGVLAKGKLLSRGSVELGRPERREPRTGRLEESQTGKESCNR